MAVVAIAMLGFGALAIPAPAANDDATASRLKLGTNAAAFYMRNALGRRPALAFQNSSGRKVRCNKRLSPIRLRCKMSWFQGDLGFWGRGTIWVTFERGGARWNFSYRVNRLNEYCAFVTHGSHCLKRFVAR